MLALTKQTVSLYVDRTNEKWIARDLDGSLWLVPSAQDGWNHREPFEITEETCLEPVPGHYRFMLGIPI